MRINFVLPRVYDRPMGGVKIVYQYAKKMADNNNDVHIYFYVGHIYDWKTILKILFDKTILKKKVKQVSWFDIKGVKLHFDQTYKDISRISEGKIIATHWSTANAVYRSHCVDKNKYYLIQDYEIFDPAVTKDELDATWNLPLKKIVISKWLYEKGKKLGVSEDDMTYVPNFIDTNDFPIIEKDPQKRNYISFLWHNNPRKQSYMGISIANKLKEKFPNIEVVMFGANITDNPEKIKIVDNASIEQLNHIYRHSLVYFMPSRSEGWGLTGMEAMACGAAVVTIDNGGIWEYANRNSAVIVKNNEDELFNAICELITNSSKRRKLVYNSFQEIKKLTLDESYKKLLSALNY